jgi:hypothetical protein
MEGEAQPDNRRDMLWELLGEPSVLSPEVKQAQEMLHLVRQLTHLRRSSTALRYGLLTTPYVTPTLYAFARDFPGDVRLVVLNNAWEPVDVTIPIHANPRLPALTRCYLHEGLPLVNELRPNDQTRIVEGSIRVSLPGKTGAVYGSVEALPGHPCAEDACFCAGRPGEWMEVDPSPAASTRE